MWWVCKVIYSSPCHYGHCSTCKYCWHSSVISERVRSNFASVRTTEVTENAETTESALSVPFSAISGSLPRAGPHVQIRQPTRRASSSWVRPSSRRALTSWPKDGSRCPLRLSFFMPHLLLEVGYTWALCLDREVHDPGVRVGFGKHQATQPVGPALRKREHHIPIGHLPHDLSDRRGAIR